jgi:hypothetical protein
MATKRKRFTVWAKSEIFNNVEILAENLEDALAQSKEMKEEDFVTVLGDYMDGSVTVTGVMES